MKQLLGLVSVCLVACAAEPALETNHDRTIDGSRLRIVAGNLPSGSGTYNDGAGIRIFQGLHADVALVQELKYADGDRAFVDTAFGTEYQLVRGNGSIPNAIVSRYPIIEGGEWDDRSVADRGFTWARIDLPGDTDLWAVSVHFLTKSAGSRNTQAHDVVAQLAAKVPSGDWIVIGGDFNTSSRGESAINTLGALFETSGPYPVDRNGNGNTNASRGKPYDWVLVSEGLDALETAVVIGSSEFSNGLVADTRVYSPIAEIAPARSSDSGTSNMQHMAVVRDFDIPGDTTPSALHVDSPNGGEELAVGSHHAITWSASGLDTLDIDYAADGSSFQRVASAVAASAGSFDWTVPAPATTTGRIRITAGGKSDTSDGDFTTTVTSEPGQVILNEVLANEAGTATSGEFIELVNTGGSTVDLSGYTLADSVAARHVFPAGTSLAAGARIVVWGNTATSGALGLSNSGDTVTLADGSGTAVDSFTFGGSPDGVSFNRSPDATTGSFVLHTTMSGASSSPGGAP